jgi:hypothetical protein
MVKKDKMIVDSDDEKSEEKSEKGVKLKSKNL